MAEAMSIVERRGACPSLDVPMRTGDGLLARLRVAGGILTPRQLLAVAVAAQQFGNGLVEVTKRGNLQVRGLRDGQVGAFGAAIEAAMAIERGLVVDVPPLAGIDPQELADPRELAGDVRQRARLAGLDERLGPKVTVVIDGQGQIGLGTLGADVRLVAAAGGRWTLAVGGRPIGLVADDVAATAAVAVLELIARQGLAARGRDVAPEQVRRAVEDGLALTVVGESEGRAAPIGRLVLERGLGQIIALPFGASTAERLLKLAAAATEYGIMELRLAPGHGLVAIGQTAEALDGWRDAADALGFVTGPLDARQAISACAGSDGCASGHIAARAVAGGIAAQHEALFDGSFELHVSGCGKGCAHPRAAALTIVGGAGNCSLVLHGRAGDMPLADIATDRLDASFDRLARLIRRNRRAGESVAACLERFDAPTIAGALRQE